MDDPHAACMQTVLGGLVEDAQAVQEKFIGFNSSSQMDVPAMRSTIESADQVFDRYDAEMSALAGIIDMLQRKREELSRHYARTVWLCSPLRRLVPDVLREIFTYLRDTQEYSLEDSRSSVIRLAHVCSHWRAVAFSQTSLWSSIKLEHAGIYEAESDRIKAAIRFHLARSGNAPLTIALWGHAYDRLEILKSVSHRWRRCVTDSSYSLGPRPLRYHCLESLVVHEDEGTVNFIDTPSLRSYVGPVEGAFLPWHQLTSVSVTRGLVTVNKVIELLRICVRLESCQVAYPQDVLQPHTVPPVTAPYLCHFRLVCRPDGLGNVLETLFSSITAPGLALLDIGVPAKLVNFVWSRNLTLALTRFLEASGTLSALALRNVPIGPDTRAVLASAPSIEELVWWAREKNADKSGLRYLCDALSSHGPDAEGGTTPPILPRLERLEISGGMSSDRRRSENKDHDRLVNIIRARAAGGGASASSEGTSVPSGRTLGGGTYPPTKGTLRHVFLKYIRWELSYEAHMELQNLLETFMVTSVMARKQNYFEYDDPDYDIDTEPPSDDESSFDDLDGDAADSDEVEGSGEDEDMD
ncbi:uncharacterized protein SCHCODRAFT_02639637 [Schizophyllum commune H4-8]|uniref:uncharacterized protein n=1 Tax=Schizophyllum commune (strain H4-8 / FGSC 9210) TaxID=578458 RepID=UPI00215E209A|nr:uncharacterized protein SCHCODRAFT_02639637 [Schizophyllum commune H4-8]KAI5888065.1 hypothetical protein SCHCODRAFT_02639637 [Schizophyllum commune H4-8]